MADGDVTLRTEPGAGAGAGGDVTVAAAVRTERGSVLVEAGARPGAGAEAYLGALTVTDAGGIETAAGDVTALAGGVVSVDGAVGTGAGLVRLATGGGVRIGGIVYTDAGDVEVSSAGGDIELGAAGLTAWLNGDAQPDRVRATGLIVLDATAGMLLQHGGRIRGARELWTRSAHGQHLAGDNAAGAWHAVNTADGDIVFYNTADTLRILGVTQNAGAVEVRQTGAAQVTGAVTTAAGDIALYVTGALTTHAVVAAGGAGGLTMTAGGDMVIGDEAGTVFGAVRLDAGGFLDVHSLVFSDSGRIDMRAGRDVVFFGAAQTGDAVTVDAGGSIINASYADNAVLTGRAVDLTAGADIGQPDRFVVVSARDVLNARAGGGVWVRGLGDVYSGHLESAAGDVTLYALEGAFRADRVAAPAGTVTVVSAGPVAVQELAAVQANFTVRSQGRPVQVTEAALVRGLTVEADVVRFSSIDHAAGGQEPLRVTVTGRHEGLADEVYMFGRSPVGVVFDRLDADFADITFITDDLAFLDVLLGSTAYLRNAHHLAVADNVERRLMDAHLQVHPRDERFYVIFAANRTILSNALDVNYDDDYIVNEFDTENSFVRSTFKYPHVVVLGEVQDAASVVRLLAPVFAGVVFDENMRLQLLEMDGTPLNTEAPEPTETTSAGEPEAERQADANERLDGNA